MGVAETVMMACMALNPDLIRPGDQVDLSRMGGEPSTWKVTGRSGNRLHLDNDSGDTKSILLGGKRPLYQLVGHQPRLC